MEELRERLSTIDALNRAEAVLSWDQETYMPEAGSPTRAEQMARIAGLAHEMFISSETGRLLDEARASDSPKAGIDEDVVRVTRRDFDLADRIPPTLIAALHRQAALAHPIWVHAREHNDFSAFAPVLEKTVELTREMAEHIGYSDRPYDALLELHEPGMTANQLDDVFADLKRVQVPLVAAIAKRAQPHEDAPLHGRFDEQRQEEFALRMIRSFGYDLTRGRLDRVVHPFETAFSRDDVRLTTRYDESNLADSLFSTLHEAGHGMYEQGVSRELEGTPLATGASSALHESQSRLWENVVGRSRPVWEHFYPALQETFPDQLGPVTLDDFYLAINRVQPSMIRVDADEVTYNLHIMLRYEMEQGLLSGAISISDAPTVWNDKMQEYLRIRPKTDSDGILQDTHWASGLFGYFPSYALGNVVSVQLFDRAVEEHPAIEDEMRRGVFGTLHGWLEQNLYRYGRRFEPNELIERATGQPMTTRPYLAYLQRKYKALYRLESKLPG
jgi:carboxypeptidase Taq